MYELLGPLFVFATVMSLTPGPNNVMVTATAANFGFRRAIPHIFGITLGFGFMIVVVGIGLAGVFRADERLHVALKYAGAAYLLYLAWRIARAGDDAGANTRAKPISFLEAALFPWINPKGWVFALGALGAYTTLGGNMLWETSVIASVISITCLVSVAIWAGFGAALGRVLGNPRARLAFNWSMAGLLVLSLIPVFW